MATTAAAPASIIVVGDGTGADEDPAARRGAAAGRIADDGAAEAAARTGGSPGSPRPAPNEATGAIVTAGSPPREGTGGDPRVAALLAEVGVPPEARAAVADRVVGHDPILPTPFPIGGCAAAAMTAGGVLAGLLWAERTGTRQTVGTAVDRATAALVSFALTSVTDAVGPPPRDPGPMTGLYRCRDGRWIHLHGGLPHLTDRAAKVLGCAPEADRAELADRTLTWESFALEDELAAHEACGAVVRSAAEWAAHPQGRAVANLGTVAIDKLGDSAPEPVGDRVRPLGGVRVLDLTRILAGPTNAGALASHGADVLLLSSPRLANNSRFLLDTSVGKRSASLDLDSAEGPATLRSLVRGADVFSQGYRSGALARRGFSPEQLCELRPGLIYVSITCYGEAGPWRERRGWEQLAQSVSGLAAEQGRAEHDLAARTRAATAGGEPGDADTPAAEVPALIPAAANDYLTGHLAALGTMAALWRRSQEGGSYRVRVSLCQTAGWLHRQQRVSVGDAPGLHPPDRWFQQRDTPWGTVRRLIPAVQMSATPARWELPSAPPGTHAPTW